MARRYDPVSGRLKSALQKYVRRGETDKALAVARAMIERNDDSPLARRLPVIAAEDVGCTYVPMAAVALDLHQRGKQVTPLLDVVYTLAEAPKQKDAYWLANLVWDGRTEARTVSGEALAQAIERGDYRGATAIVFKAGEEKKTTRLALPIMQLYAKTDAARWIVKWALWRYGMGGGEELLAAAVIAVIDGPPEVEQPKTTQPARALPGIDWYCLDGHTDIGAIALGSLAKKQGVTYELLNWLMFDYESSLVSPELPSRWKDEALTLDGKEQNWGTISAGARQWAAMREDAKGLIEWLMEQKGVDRWT